MDSKSLVTLIGLAIFSTGCSHPKQDAHNYVPESSKECDRAIVPTNVDILNLIGTSYAKFRCEIGDLRYCPNYAIGGIKVLTEIYSSPRIEVCKSDIEEDSR